MMRSFTAISALALLTACGDGQPFFDVDDGDAPDVEIELDGTENPSSNRSISRIEPGADTDDDTLIANETGGGLVREVTYDAASDTYTVDNLAFDGDLNNAYERSTVLPTLGGYQVYEAADSVPDFLTDASVRQIGPYVAVTGISNVASSQDASDPRTSFAIVRTGGYAGYGFGGFVYERNGGVTLPTSGQAQFEGAYAGVRVFDTIGRLEYTNGDVEIAFDFDDFNLNNGVKGSIVNRQVFDESGTELPVIFENDRLLPGIGFTVVQGVDTLLPSGELTGELSSVRINSDGVFEDYEQGQYYAIVAGDTTSGDGGEVVGVFVVTSEDPRFEDIFVQETGGFILQRSE